MPKIGVVRCHGCDFKGFMHNRPIKLLYVLPNGSFVQGHRRLAWCYSCENITDAETAFDAASIQTEIDSRTRQKVNFHDRLFSNEKDEDVELNRLIEMLHLAQRRQSDPRCLKCGEANVASLNFDNSGTSSVVHTCGERLYKVPDNPDAPNFMFRSEEIRLDPEGRKI